MRGAAASVVSPAAGAGSRRTVSAEVGKTASASAATAAMPEIRTQGIFMTLTSPA
jgi:hypothetical protein